ncbi:uncharacterized protein [Panulirus ornatus]|uniref:uncharacterized protein n=1 Tax=Panulirus ornatus TaxID=150431 RepID=UPI003A881E3D
MLTVLRRRRGALLYLACSCALLVLCFLTSATRDARVSHSTSGEAYPWQMVGYDEYGCGCPRSGPPIVASSQASLCSDWSTSRGLGQKVVSYSVYGDMNDKQVYKQYYSAIEDRIKDVEKYYKGWIMRLYHNQSRLDARSMSFLCRLYCLYPHFDPCQVDELYPTEQAARQNQRRPATVNFTDYEMYLRDTMKGKSVKYYRVPMRIVTPKEGGGGTTPAGKESKREEEEEAGRAVEGVSGDTGQRGSAGSNLRSDAAPPTQSSRHNRGGLSFERLLVGKMWRFVVMADPLVVEFLVRDTDSVVLPREVSAVDQWLTNSTAVLHVMRDHPSHNGLILAGMWGGSRLRGGDKLTELLKGMMRWPPRNLWDYDQILLKRVVWPEVLDTVLAHDSYFCANPHFRSRHRSVPFPTRRQGRYFVGWGPTRNHELPGVLPCPRVCRPPEHQDWVFC